MKEVLSNRWYTYFDFTVISLNTEVGIKEKILFTSENKAKEIYDITGKKIKDLKRMKKGVYFYKDKWFKKMVIF